MTITAPSSVGRESGRVGTGLPTVDLDTWVAPDSAASLRLTEHAVQRYRERVESSSRRSARRALERLVEQAIVARRPPHWLAGALTDGVAFGTTPARPDVCLIVASGAVVTVLRADRSHHHSSHQRVAKVGRRHASRTGVHF